ILFAYTTLFRSGEKVVQEILQYPGGNVVVLAGESGFYGVDAGLGTRTLEGTGWAVGVLLRPAAAGLLLRADPRASAAAAGGEAGAELRTGHVELGGDFAAACTAVRALMPGDPQAAGKVVVDWV